MRTADQKPSTKWFSMQARLTLEDGRTFACRSFTGPGEAGGEVVFNTSMTGYQEVLTDPSYSGQMVAMTYPLVGNTGVNLEDIESARIQVAAFLVREYQAFPSNFRSTQPLADYLRSQGVLGVDGLDTRALTRHIRNGGAMRAIVSTTDLDPASLTRRAQALPSMAGMDLAREVTTATPYRWKGNAPDPLGTVDSLDAGIWRQRGNRPAVVALDFGLKFNIIRCLERVGFEVVVVPAATDASAITAMAPDGLFLSNGPGDPAARHLRRPDRSRAAGPTAHLRHLFGQSDFGPGAGRIYLQAQIRSPRYQPAGQEPDNRQGRDHLPESWVRCGQG
jgi:carbamoyl-phosphate synthase small subunit